MFDVMEICDSCKVDFKQTFNLSVAKAMSNKTLQQVLRDQSIDFDSSVKLPPRLTYEKDKIKTLNLFLNFSEKVSITMTWINLSSKFDFELSL